MDHGEIFRTAYQYLTGSVAGGGWVPALKGSISACISVLRYDAPAAVTWRQSEFVTRLFTSDHFTHVDGWADIIVCLLWSFDLLDRGDCYWSTCSAMGITVMKEGRNCLSYFHILTKYLSYFHILTRCLSYFDILCILLTQILIYRRMLLLELCDQCHNWPWVRPLQKCLDVKVSGHYGGGKSIKNESTSWDKNVFVVLINSSLWRRKVSVVGGDFKRHH